MTYSSDENEQSQNDKHKKNLDDNGGDDCDARDGDQVCRLCDREQPLYVY